MPNKSRISYLLNKCLTQQETLDEREELNQYFLNDSLKSVIEECMLAAFDTDKSVESLPVDKQNQILTAIYSSSDTNNKLFLSNVMWRWASVAAVFLMITIPLIIKTDFHKKILQLSIISNVVHKDNVVTEVESKMSKRKESATLDMADGTKLYLPKLDIGKEIIQSGLRLRRLADDELSIKFDLNRLNTKIMNSRHVINTPKGTKFKLILPDGSIVHLNAASKLVLPNTFNDSVRYVELVGEAYFEVAKSDKRFSVYSQKGNIKQEVKVFGTKFNISAYSDDQVFTTTLVEGSVQIQKLNNSQEFWLKPNESATHNADGLLIEAADLDLSLAWVNNVFYFEDIALDVVLKQISRWYDVDFKNVPHFPKQKLWAQLSRDISLEDLLAILEKTYSIKFKRIGKEVYVVD